MKKMLNSFDCAGQICEAMKKGILLTTKAGDKVNTMTIGWGTIGVEWGKPIFIGFVRESRYTKTLLDQNPQFTINVPMGGDVKEILKVCGTKSGRDMDKFAAMNLTAAEPEVISVPGIQELPLTLECKVIYKQEQNPAAIEAVSLQRYYPEGDFHTAYYGEIVSAYILE